MLREMTEGSHGDKYNDNNFGIATVDFESFHRSAVQSFLQTSG